MNKIILLFILCILTGCSGGGSNNISMSSNEQIKVAIYPTGTLSESYCFVLNTDGELIVEKGTRQGDDITQNPFIKDSKETKKKKLSSSEISEIVDIANEIYKTNYRGINEMIDDSWEIQILYQKKVVRQDYWHNISPEVKEFIDEFIKISPIVVDLHGWS